MTLILPGDPEFDQTLGTVLPPAPDGCVYIVRPGCFLMEAVSEVEATEYLCSGEYDDREAELAALEDEEISGFSEHYEMALSW